MSRSRWLRVSAYFPPRVGGTSTVVRTLLGHLDQQAVDVVAAEPAPHLTERAEQLGCRVRWFRDWDETCARLARLKAPS